MWKKILPTALTAFCLTLGFISDTVMAEPIITEEVEADGEARQGDNDTPKAVREAAYEDAKRIAVERVAVNIVSQSSVDMGMVTQDTVMSYAKARMKVVAGPDYTYSGEHGSICRAHIKAKVEVDLGQLTQQASKPAQPTVSQPTTPPVQPTQPAQPKLNPNEIRGHGEYHMGDRDTFEDAKRQALAEAKRDALEQKATYIVSTTDVKDYQLVMDYISSRAEGIITLLGSPVYKENGRIYTADIVAVVNVDVSQISRPAQPVRQTQPVQPIQQVQPAQPVQPVQQVQPAQPFQPVQPVRPAMVGTALAKDMQFSGNGHWYTVVDIAADWNRADDICKKNGGHLAYIKSAKEQMFIESLMKSKGRMHVYWLGAKQSLSDTKKWTWGDGTPLTYTHWAEGQPDNPKENKLMIYNLPNPYNNDQPGLWNDLLYTGECNGEEFFGAHNCGFICEWDS